MIEKVRNNLRCNGIIYLAILLNMVFLVVYLIEATRNVVFMDYWRLAEKFIPLIMENRLSFSDFWVAYWGQRNPLLFILLCLNIKFFNFNTLISVFLGAITIGAVCITFYFSISKKISNNKTRGILQLIYIPIIMSFFNLNQWEIMENQFSFSFFLRVWCYLVIFILLDKAMYNKEHIKLILISGILSFLSICGISQLYFGGMIIAVLLVFIINLIIKKKNAYCYFKYFFIWFILSGLAVWLYMCNMDMNSSGSNFFKFIASIFDGTFFQALFYIIDGSLLQINVMQIADPNSINIIGIILLSIIILCIFFYFKSKMYEDTYIPLFMIAYGLFSMLIIMYGRMFEYDIRFLASSRYVVDTTLLWVGCISVMIYVWIKNKSKFMLHLLIFISISYIYCDYQVYIQRESKGMYKENIAFMCTQIDQYTDEELIVMQANDPEIVRNVCALMKKYNLNVFSENY